MSIINNKFKIRELIAEGQKNDILLAYAINNEKVVIKFEKEKLHEGEHSMIRHEFKIYKELQGAFGFCKVYWFGQHDGHNVLILELLYYSIENLFAKCHMIFTLKTTLQLADQMIERIQQLHENHIIHRDIKPANMAMGLGKNSNLLYFIDFGLSKRYRHPKTVKHIPYSENKQMVGTPRFASINNHLGRELSRRDDLESIGYVLVFLLRGFLPWQDVRANSAIKKYYLIGEMKKNIPLHELCYGCPDCLLEFIKYSRTIAFDETPNYYFLRKEFSDLYKKKFTSEDINKWDWLKVCKLPQISPKKN